MDGVETPLNIDDEEELFRAFVDRFMSQDVQPRSADDLTRRPIALEATPRRAKTAPRTHANLEKNCRKARRLVKKKEKAIAKFDAKKEKLLDKLDSYKGGEISRSKLNSSLDKLASLNCKIQRLEYRRMIVMAPPKKAKLNLTIFEKIIQKLETINEKYKSSSDLRSRIDNENNTIKKEFGKLVLEGKNEEATAVVEGFHPEYKPEEPAEVPQLSDDEIRALIEENQRLRSQLSEQTSRTQQPAEQQAPTVVESEPSEVNDRLARAEERVTLAEQKYAAERKRAVDAEAKVIDAEKRAINAEQQVVSEKRRADDAEAKLIEAEKRVTAAEQRAESEKRRADGAEAKLAEFEKRVIAAEKKAEAAEKKITIITDALGQAAAQQAARQEPDAIQPELFVPASSIGPVATPIGEATTGDVPITAGNGGAKK